MFGRDARKWNYLLTCVHEWPFDIKLATKYSQSVDFMYVSHMTYALTSAYKAKGYHPLYINKELHPVSYEHPYGSRFILDYQHEYNCCWCPEFWCDRLMTTPDIGYIYCVHPGQFIVSRFILLAVLIKRKAFEVVILVTHPHHPPPTLHLENGLNQEEYPHQNVVK